MKRPIGKIAFVSPQCVLDFTNGAATATRDGLRLLLDQGFQCRAFCGTRSDEPQEGLLQECLFRRGVRYEVRKAKIGPYDGRLLFTVDGNLPVTVFENASTGGGWLNVQEAAAFLTGYEIFLRRNRPDLVWTYGGDPASIAVQSVAKRLQIPILFVLRNFSYAGREPFELVDCVTVPSEFSRAYYKETLGLSCRVLPNIVNGKAANVSGTLRVPPDNRHTECAGYIEVRDVHQSEFRQGGLRLRADCPGVGAAAARYPDPGYARPQPRRRAHGAATGAGAAPCRLVPGRTGVRRPEHQHDGLCPGPAGLLSDGLFHDQATLDALLVVRGVRPGGCRGDAQRHPRPGERSRGLAGNDRRRRIPGVVQKWRLAGNTL